MIKKKSKLTGIILIIVFLILLCIILSRMFNVTVTVKKRVNNDITPSESPVATEQPFIEDIPSLYSYSVDKKTVCINEYLGGARSAVIPSVIEGCPVTEIRCGAFSDNDSLTYVRVPDSVKCIQENAISNCSSLLDIDVGYNNNTYSSVDGVLFDKAQSMLIYYPNGRKSASYRVPEGVVIIGQRAFSDNKMLADVELPIGLISIEEYAFENCEGLAHIEIPESVITIKEYAFFNCNSMTDIKLSSWLLTIGDYALESCQSLTDINLPCSLFYIGKDIFANCTALTDITVDSGNISFSSDDGVLFNKDKSVLICCPFGKKLSSYKVPAGVQIIKTGAFGAYKTLTSVSFPVELTEIENAAFYSCNFLKDIYYEGSKEQWSVINIGQYNEAVQYGKLHYLEY